MIAGNSVDDENLFSSPRQASPTVTPPHGESSVGESTKKGRGFPRPCPLLGSPEGTIASNRSLPTVGLHQALRFGRRVSSPLHSPFLVVKETGANGLARSAIPHR